MSTFVDFIKIFKLNSKLKIARGMQYRADFFIGLFVSLGLSSLGPIFQYLIFSNCNGYPNWNLKQIILFQGVMLLWFGIKDMFFGEVRGTVEAMIRGGDFDRLLLKPYPPIGIILTSGFYFQGLGSIIGGLTIITYSIQSMSLDVSIIQIGLFITFIIAGIILYMAVTVIYCTIAITIVYMGRLGEIIDRLLQFSQYPLEIFFPVVRIVFITFFPVAVWIYFPTQALLNRVGVSAITSLFSCLILFYASILIWNKCLKKYKSVGG
ncbi:MAG TPA: ABC-2 family transporter protein [Clostridia bacterium]|nr:ABC-2 family transporter protein [Clostridia bacterium]